ncbi:hypothetical protein [Mycolicibacterium sp.]|uniref:hypothetical protein n=1 Tax=Mycolicibacterium sp. TaxID=2320850 RepID=UPI0009591A96|nr:hypothetical protein EB73_34140 [Mycobacterium sp. SWH-M3]
MTVYPLERVRSFRWDVQPTAGTIVDDTVVPRRCAVWRKAFKGSAVSYGAALLGHAPAVSWMRRHRVTVDIGTAGEFSRAVAAGIAPAQLVMHADTDAAVRCAVSGGAGRVIVGTAEQLTELGHSDRVHRVLVDARQVRRLAAQALVCRQVELIGLHCTLDDPDDPIGVHALRAAIADMAWIRREHSVVLNRISLSGLDAGALSAEPRVLRQIADAVGEVVGDNCARFRFPRPALTVAPRTIRLIQKRFR